MVRLCAGKRHLTHRLVVPVAFLPVLRAEQTTTTLLESKLALGCIVSSHARCRGQLVSVPYDILSNLEVGAQVSVGRKRKYEAFVRATNLVGEFSHTRATELLDHPAIAGVVLVNNRSRHAGEARNGSRPARPPLPTAMPDAVSSGEARIGGVYLHTQQR